MLTLLGTARGLGAVMAFGALLLMIGHRDLAAQTPAKPKTVEKTAPKPPEQKEQKEEAEPEQEQEAKSPEEAKKAAEKKQVATIAAKKAKALQLFESGSKALAAGKNEEAVKSLSHALDTGGLTQTDVARALYRRGIAHRKLGRGSLAIADLTQAMYLTGLSDAERLDARYQRGLAYQSAGLNDKAAEDLKAGKALDPSVVATAPAPVEQKAPPAPVPTKEPVKEARPVPPAPESKPVATETKPAPTPPTTTANSPSSVSNFFSNLFSSQPKEAKAPAPRTSTWQQATEVKLVTADPAVKANAPAPRPVVIPSATREITTAAIEKDQKVTLQIASLRTEAQAVALVRQVKQSHRDLLSGRDIRIEKSVIGTMGTFYQVRISSFASETDGLSHCGRLRQTGLDCMIVK